VKKEGQKESEKDAEMSAGSSAIHFQAHKPECFVCAPVNKTKSFLPVFSLALKVSYQHNAASPNLLTTVPRSSESVSS
jgi:hypothetical protein